MRFEWHCTLFDWNHWLLQSPNHWYTLPANLFRSNHMTIICPRIAKKKKVILYFWMKYLKILHLLEGWRKEIFKSRKIWMVVESQRWLESLSQILESLSHYFFLATDSISNSSFSSNKFGEITITSCLTWAAPNNTPGKARNFPFSDKNWRTCLVVQWTRICLPMQET